MVHQPHELAECYMYMYFGISSISTCFNPFLAPVTRAGQHEPSPCHSLSVVDTVSYSCRWYFFVQLLSILFRTAAAGHWPYCSYSTCASLSGMTSSAIHVLYMCYAWYCSHQLRVHETYSLVRTHLSASRSLHLILGYNWKKERWASRQN